VAEPALLVPFGDDGNFSLYKVSFSEDYGELRWSILHPGNDPEIRDKLGKLEDYFKQRHCKKNVGGQFVGISELDGSDFKALTPSTPSIFLGLFLAAACKMQRRKLRSSLASVTVTGDLDCDESAGEMRLKEVGDIPQKYRAFEGYANKNTGKGKHLFAYVSADEQVLEREGENIIVKRFSSKDSIFKIAGDVFEPYAPNMDMPDLDETQQRLLNGANGGQRCLSYIATPDYEKNRQEAFSRDWTGFFIHGEGASGKSAMAEALIRDMMQAGRIYAPLWISVKDTECGSGKIGRKANYVYGIYEQLGIAPGDTDALKRAFSENQYLIAFDNLEMGVTQLSSFLDEVSGFFRPIYKNRPFLLITSRGCFSDLVLPNNIKPICPPMLEQKDIDFMIRSLATHGGFLGKIEAEKDTEEYKQFLSEIVSQLASAPGLIGPALNILRENTPGKALSLLKNAKDKSFHKNIIAIYSSSFQSLPKKAQVILFGMLDWSSPDALISKEEWSSLLHKNSFIKENGFADDDDIKEALGILLGCHFIYRADESGEPKYGIKSHCFLAFAFEPEFEGEFCPKAGKCLRDQVMADNSWKLHIALRYDRSSKYVEPILKALKKSEFSNESHLFVAAVCSSSPGNLELLKNYLGGKIDTQNKDGDTPLMYAAAANPHLEVMNWFLGKGEGKANLSKKAITRKNKMGFNALFHAARENTNSGVLKALVDTGYFNINERLKKGYYAGHAPFSLAASLNTSISICEYFADDLSCDVNGMFKVDHSRSDLPLDSACDDKNARNKNLMGIRNLGQNFPIKLPEFLDRLVFGADRGTPLFILAMNNSNVKAIEKILSSPKFDKGWTLKNTSSPLQLCALAETRSEVLDLFLKYGSNGINEGLDMSAFMWAATANGYLPVFDWFEKNGADIYATEKTGVSAYDYVLDLNPHKEEVIKWFEKRDFHTHLESRLIADYTEAIRLDRDNAKAYRNRGFVCQDRGQHDLAIADFSEAVRISPKDAYAYVARGDAYRQKGQHDFAIRDYTESIRLNPADAHADRVRRLIRAANKQYDSTMERYEKAFRLGLNGGDTYLLRAGLYCEQGQYELAIKDYAKAIKLDRKNASRYMLRGKACCAQGQYELAIKDFSKAIKLGFNGADAEPGLAEAAAYSERGLAYFRQKQYGLAIKDFASAVALDSGNAEAFFRRGRAYFAKGQYEAAIADFSEAAGLDSSNAAAFRRRGDALRMQGKGELAERDYAEAAGLEQASGENAQWRR